MKCEMCKAAHLSSTYDYICELCDKEPTILKKSCKWGCNLNRIQIENALNKQSMDKYVSEVIFKLNKTILYSKVFEDVFESIEEYNHGVDLITEDKDSSIDEIVMTTLRLTKDNRLNTDFCDEMEAEWTS